MDSYITKKNNKNYFDKHQPKLKSILKKSGHKSKNKVHYRSPLNSPSPKKNIVKKSNKKVSININSERKQKSIDSYFKRKDEKNSQTKKSLNRLSKQKSGSKKPIDRKNMKLVGEKTINMTKKSQKRQKKRVIRINNKNLYPNIRVSNKSIGEMKKNLKDKKIINDGSLAPDRLMSNLYTLLKRRPYIYKQFILKNNVRYIKRYLYYDR